MGTVFYVDGYPSTCSAAISDVNVIFFDKKLFFKINFKLSIFPLATPDWNLDDSCVSRSFSIGVTPIEY